MKKFIRALTAGTLDFFKELGKLSHRKVVYHKVTKTYKNGKLVKTIEVNSPDEDTEVTDLENRLNIFSKKMDEAFEKMDEAFKKF